MSPAESDALARLGIDALEHGARLWLLVPLAAAGLGLAWRARPSAFEWSAWSEAKAAGARRLDALRITGLVLRGGALLALAAVLAGPIGVHRAPPEPGMGLDIVLAVDASGSMRALDIGVGGASRTRLDLARQVVARFASRRAADGDRIALVVFGDSAFTHCPLTSDGRLLAAALERIEPGVAGEATALGDALALSVRRALGGESGGGSGPLAGRVIVLLTDGRNNAGALSVEAATALATGEGVRVHTVAIGTAGDSIPMAPSVAAGARRFERHDIDAETLARIAASTGGRFFSARRSADLDRVYREIDGLERVSRRLPRQRRQSDRPEPLLAAAGALLLCEIAAARVLRRRLP